MTGSPEGSQAFIGGEIQMESVDRPGEWLATDLWRRWECPCGGFFTTAEPPAWS